MYTLSDGGGDAEPVLLAAMCLWILRAIPMPMLPRPIQPSLTGEVLDEGVDMLLLFLLLLLISVES